MLNISIFLERLNLVETKFICILYLFYEKDVPLEDSPAILV